MSNVLLLLLQVVLQYMFRDAIAVESPKLRQSLYDGKLCKFKIKDSIPHDLGEPGKAYNNDNNMSHNIS